MADQQANTLASVFPTPPPFYTHFTAENLERLANLETDLARDAESEEDKLAIVNAEARKDAELRFLVPPPPPTEGIWKQFGDLFKLNDTLPSLKDQGIDQLYPDPQTIDGQPSTQPHKDTPLLLKRLSKSLLLNFLELVGILSTNPSQYAEKLADIRVQFINFHHLCNEYRPHQARETLVGILEMEVERCRNEVEGVKRMKWRVEEVLKQIEGLGGEAFVGSDDDKREEKVDKRARWDDVFLEFGPPGEKAGSAGS